MRIDKLKLNFFKEYYLFYDWLESDNIIEEKNIILVKVKSCVIKDFINYQIKLLDTDLKQNNILLFTDGYSFIAIKFDKEGNTLAKSSLLLEDEIKLEEKIDELKLVNITYEKLKKASYTPELRADAIIKLALQNAILALEAENNYDKLAYFYYEWFHKTEKDIMKMISNMQKRLCKNIGADETYVYYLIKRSYKTV